MLKYAHNNIKNVPKYKIKFCIPTVILYIKDSNVCLT